MEWVTQDDFRQIGLNIFSAFLGAILLYLATNGVAATRKSREASRQRLEERVKIYAEGSWASQRLITEYLISIAKRYLIANIVWTAQGFLPNVETLPAGSKLWASILNYGLGASSVIAFILALSKLSELDRIRRRAHVLSA